MRKKKEVRVKEALLGGAQKEISPGCSIGLAGTFCAGTLGCIITDGHCDFGLTCAHVVLSKEEDEKYCQGTGTYIDQATKIVVHPSEPDIVIRQAVLKQEIERLESALGRTTVRTKIQNRQLQEMKNQLLLTKTQGIGNCTLRVLSFGDSPLGEQQLLQGRLCSRSIKLEHQLHQYIALERCISTRWRNNRNYRRSKII
jgi:hypothetical protein